MKLAEALAPELPPDRAEAVMDEYLHLYNGFYLENMRKKLGLLKKDEPEDEILITELLQTMHNTGRMRVGGHIVESAEPLNVTLRHIPLFENNAVVTFSVPFLQVLTSPTLSVP